jgi:hypothetical protein
MTGMKNIRIIEKTLIEKLYDYNCIRKKQNA